MTRISHRLAAGGLALALIACGEDNICLNCGAVPEPTPGPRDVVSVEGNIRNWDTQDDLTRIKVIGCIDLAPDAPPEAFTNCPNTGNGFPDSSGNFAFEFRNEAEGTLQIAFWVCRREPEDCGRIEPTDDFARLEDPDGTLSDVDTGETAEISNVSISFSDRTAEAGFLRVSLTPIEPPDPSDATDP